MEQEEREEQEGRGEQEGARPAVRPEEEVPSLGAPERPLEEAFARVRIYAASRGFSIGGSAHGSGPGGPDGPGAAGGAGGMHGASGGVSGAPLGFGDELRLRAASAAPLLFWVVLFVWLGGFFSALLAVIAAAIAAFEWRRLMIRSHDPGEVPLWHHGGAGPAEAPPALGGFWLGAGLVLAPLFATSGMGLALAWLVLTLAVAVALERRWRSPRPSRAMLALFGGGGMWIGLALVAWVVLRGLPEGRALLFWILFAVWAYESGAWFVGKSLGGPRLAPRISPGKTWSGLLGGLAVAAAVGWLAGRWLLPGLPGESAVLFAVATGLAAQGGDLAESATKRYVGVKDSGGLLPGHGGFLDRIDGLVAALVLWLLLLRFSDTYALAALSGAAS